MYVQENHKPLQKVKDLIDESEKAVREGDSRRAHELSIQATHIAPEQVDAWLLRATLAPSVEERLLCVNRLNELAPGYPDRYNVAYFALKDALDRQPFLAYLEETDELYRVLDADHQILSIPKKRAPVNPFPPEELTAMPLRPAYLWLGMSILGLLLAGIGTVVFAPLAVLAAVQAHASLRTPAEQVSSAVVLVIAFGLFVIGVIFSLLFLLHWFS